MLKKSLSDPVFPYPTLLIHLAGCLAIGIAYSILENNNTAKLIIIIGFLGGFTTFSTFGLELLTLIRAGSLGMATLYVTLSSFLGIFLVWLGMTIARLN